MASTVILIVQIYLGFGLLTALLFFLFGMERVEPNTRGSFAFRPLLVPGLCLLWPLVLWRWYVLAKNREDD